MLPSKPYTVSKKCCCKKISISLFSHHISVKLLLYFADISDMYWQSYDFADVSSCMVAKILIILICVKSKALFCLVFSILVSAWNPSFLLCCFVVCDDYLILTNIISQNIFLKDREERRIFSRIYCISLKNIYISVKNKRYKIM